MNVNTLPSLCHYAPLIRLWHIRRFKNVFDLMMMMMMTLVRTGDENQSRCGVLLLAKSWQLDKMSVPWRRKRTDVRRTLVGSFYHLLICCSRCRCCCNWIRSDCSARQLSLNRCYNQCRAAVITTVVIVGDTHTAEPAITVPLRILGQQPIQNAAPTPTMLLILSVVIKAYVLLLGR